MRGLQGRTASLFPRAYLPEPPGHRHPKRRDQQYVATHHAAHPIEQARLDCEETDVHPNVPVPLCEQLRPDHAQDCGSPLAVHLRKAPIAAGVPRPPTMQSHRDIAMNFPARLYAVPLEHRPAWCRRRTSFAPCPAQDHACLGETPLFPPRAFLVQPEARTKYRLIQGHSAEERPAHT